ncbi:MAG: hypothetical protein ACE5FI_07170 [Anaerolineales bacterium]
MTRVEHVHEADASGAAPTHPWVRTLTVSYVPGKLDARLEWLVAPLLDWLRQNAHTVQADGPTDGTDLIITTAIAGNPVERRDALFFQAKRLFKLSRRPHVLTLVSVPQVEYEMRLRQFRALASSESKGAALSFPGMGPEAIAVLRSQARRGPIVAFGRYLQTQVKSIRVVALVGGDGPAPERAIHFDLAGAHAETPAGPAAVFAKDVGRRIATQLSTHEVKEHEIVPDAVSAELWDNLKTPEAMVRAGPLFTEYGFFTDPVSVEKLLGFKGVSEVIAAQYSEGCYAAYDPDLGGLITTATGSARLVDKRAISPEDLAYVSGVRAGGDGALVGTIDGRPVVVPSVEAVELRGICDAVSKIVITNSQGEAVSVPAVRAILHGHVGVDAYNPKYVERITLDEPFYHYPVSCGTKALALGTAQAFARSQTLRDPNDPRKIVFLEQPCHGVLVAEKWTPGAEAFETIHGSLQSKRLNVSQQVPQGPITWRESGNLVVKA